MTRPRRLKGSMANFEARWAAVEWIVLRSLSALITAVDNNKLIEAIEGQRVTQQPSFRYCEPVAHKNVHLHNIMRFASS